MALRTRVHQGDLLTNAAVTLLTFNNFLVDGGAILRNVILAHQGGETDPFTTVIVHIVPFGASPTQTNCVIQYEMPPNTWANLPGPWLNNSLAYISALYQSSYTPNISIRLAAFERYLAI